MAVRLDVEREMAAGVDAEELGFERDPDTEGDLMAEAGGALVARELAAGEALLVAPELEPAGQVDTGCEQAVLGEEPRLAGQGALAEVRRLVPGRERDALVEGEREAAELPAGRPDQGELAVEPEVAERLARQRGVAEDALLDSAGGVPLLEQQHGEVEADRDAVPDPDARSHVGGDLVRDDVEGDSPCF